MTEEAPQDDFFGADPNIKPPEEPYQSIYVHFETLEDLRKFAELIGQPVTTQTRAICYPPDPRYVPSKLLPPPEAAEAEEPEQ